MNQWVGIVALRDAPSAVAVPLHRMAAAIAAANRIRSYVLSGGRKVRYSDVREALRAIGRRYASADTLGRSAEAFTAARFFADHTDAWRELPWWLQHDLGDELDRRRSGRRRSIIPGHAPAHTSARPASRRQPAPPPAPAAVSRAPLPRKSAPTQASHHLASTFIVDRKLDVLDVIRPSLTDPGPAFDSIELPTALTDWLEKAGCPLAEDPVRDRWIRIATLHTSFVYEQATGPVSLVGPHLVPMLGSLGATWLDLLVLDTFAADPTISDEGAQSTRLARTGPSTLARLGRWAAHTGFVRRGRGEQLTDTAGVFETVALQFLGALLLTGAHRALLRLVEEQIPSTGTRGADESDAPGQYDWYTLLQRQPSARDMEWEFAASGPQHAVSYSGTVRTRDGRSAVATGGSKKEARQAASREFFRIHMPDVMKQTSTAAAVPHGQVRLPLRYSGNEPGHAQAVDDLRVAFELTRDADPWLSQALIHRSWAHENPRSTATSRQRSNTLLAHHGSHVAHALMAYDRALEAAGRGLRPTAEEARIGSVANTECRRLGAALRLVPGMLIGAGERKNDMSDPSDGAAQAVLATAWRCLGTRLLVRRPRVLHEWFAGMDYGLDPSTQLARLCDRFGITMAPDFLVRGPDHGQERLCELTFTGPDATARWTGQALRGGKTQAKHQACHEVLELLHEHAEGSRSTWSPHERELLRFLLRRQLIHAPSLSAKHQQRCVQGGELGLDALATGDDAAFRAWATRTTDLVGTLAPETSDGLLRFYIGCLGLVRYGSDSPLRTALREAAVECGPSATTHAAQATLRAAASTAKAGSALREVLGTWWTEPGEARRVRMQDEAGIHGGMLLGGGEAAALREVLDWTAQAAQSVDRAVAVDLSLDGGRPYLLLGIDGVDLPATSAVLLTLLAEVVPSMQCTAADGELLVHWRPPGAGQGSQQNSNPIGVAGLTALATPLDVPRDLFPAHTETEASA
ncbi:hypothetical protein [Streptomyces erythrochromogenes]|uniref:hypothetical protein n=1 Tax=Streptomyces erythrochromogenes TaxID=285574 RepID=UPI0037D81DC8